MKHSLKIVLILLGMFITTQLIGLAVADVYNIHNDQIPYGMEPPKGIAPSSSLTSIVFAIAIAVALLFLLMKLRTEFLLRIWFFIVIILALSITFNALFLNTFLSEISFGIPFFTNASSLLAFALALPLSYIKVYKRDILVHNITELLIYPGIAVIFIPLLDISTTVLLLILISAYDIYAVWHAGFMQKMAKYQIQNVKVFSGFFIPYVGKKEQEMLLKAKSKKTKLKKIKVNLAILGGGDVVFPIILAGVILRSMGMVPALIISLGATIALAGLFYISKKGKFYPAMPFISTGCFIALGLIYFFGVL